MVSLKVLLVLTLIVAVTCDPCHLKHPKLKKKLCDKHHKRARCGAEVAVKGGLKESCRFLFKGLKKHCNFRKNVYAELIHLRLPTDIDSSLSFLLRLGLGCGSAIDIIIPGLGDLVSRLIGLSLRNIACFRGALGHRGFCNEGDYDDFFGISFGGISSIDALFKRFKCHNARSEIEEFINKDSNGKGIDSYTGSKRIVIDIVFDILKMVEKKESKKELCKKDLTFLTDRIIALTGAIGNDFSKDFGNSFTEHAVSSLDKYLVNVGCPALSGRKDNIITTIKDSNTDNENADLPWGDLSDDGKDYSADDDDDDATLAVTVNSPLGGYFEVFFKPILKGKGRCRVSRDTLNELMSMKTPSNFVDVANFLSNLSIVLANVVDTLAYGVGNLVGRMLLFISRATLCIKNNGNDGYCSKNYVKAFGIDGSASSVADLAELYKLKDAKQQVIDLIYKHTNGKDVDQVKKGAQRVILKSCVKLAELVDSFDENSYSKSYIEMAKMMGTVANSFDEKHELGDKITSAMSSACDKYVQQKGFTAIQDRQEDIKKTTMSSKSDSTFYQSITTTTVVTITTTTESVEQSSSSVETNEVEE